MSFEEYCRSKKIDPKAFAEGNPAKWQELKVLFEQIHPNSFTQQKKFLINDLRRTYHLEETDDSSTTEVKKASIPKPAIKKASGVKPKIAGAPKIPKPNIPKRP